MKLSAHSRPAPCLVRWTPSRPSAGGSRSPLSRRALPKEAYRPPSRLITPVAATAPQDYTTELAAAEKRWEDQIREGKVKSINAKVAGDLQKDGWVILDVRPPNETAKAGVAGAVEVPIYVPEDEVSIGAFLKKLSALGLGGWWLGGTHMKPNRNFMNEVTTKVPKDAKVVVTCQKGLRSLSAAEQLSRAGYTTLAWINGGLDTAQKGDFQVINSDDLRYGGIGGLSELLGWTTVQRESSSGFLGGSENIIKAAIVVLILDGVWFGWDQLTAILHKGSP